MPNRTPFIIAFCSIFLLAAPGASADITFDPPECTVKADLSGPGPDVEGFFLNLWKNRVRARINDKLLDVENYLIESDRNSSSARDFLVGLILKRKYITKVEADELAIRLLWLQGDSRHVTDIPEWLNQNATADTLDRMLKFLNAPPNDWASSSYYDSGFLSLQKWLVNYGIQHGFNAQVAEYLDHLPLSQKLLLSDQNLFGLITAQAKAPTREGTLRLTMAKALLLESLKESFDQKGIQAFESAVENDLSLENTYKDFTLAVLSVTERHEIDTVRLGHPAVDFLYRLSRHRLQNALNVPVSTGSNYVPHNMMYSSASMIVIILDSLMSSNPLHQVPLTDLAQALNRWIFTVNQSASTQQFLIQEFPELEAVLQIKFPAAAPRTLIHWQKRKFRFRDLVRD